MEKKRSFVKDLFVVSIGNVFVLIASILVGLIVPKLMGVTNYGYYQIFTLYMSYTALLHVGYIDGVLLVHGGQSYEEIDKRQFRLNTKFFVVFQAIISVIVAFATFIFLQGIYRFIFAMVAIDTFVTNITKYYQFVSQCTMRFREWSLRRIIQAILKIIVIVLLVVMNGLGCIDSVSCKIFISAIVVIDTLLLFWYIYTYREISFGDSVPIQSNWGNVLKYFKRGIALTIAFEISSLIFSLDRQFVSVLFDTDTYGIYSFAYRLVAMVTTIVGAVSTVLFPNLKRKSKEQIIDSFDSNMALLSMVVFSAMIGYYPLCGFIKLFLSEYANSLVYFKILFPGIALTSCISAIIFNYYKVLDKNLLYFKICTGVFAFAVVSNYVLYLFVRTPESFSIASIITLFVWYIGSELYLVKKYSVKWIKNLLFIVIIMMTFYGCTEVFQEALLGTTVYGLVFVIVSIWFYGDLLKKNLSKFR